MRKSLLLVICLAVFALTLAACEQTSTPPEYSVTWKSENGTDIATTKVAEGATPSYDYSVQDTAEWDYTFEGWSLTQNGTVLNTLPSATADATYYAIVSKIKQRYTVKFDTNGGSAVADVTQEYNTPVAVPTAPTKDGYRFVGWCSDSDLLNEVAWPVTLTADVTYYAVWNKQVDIKGYLSQLLNGYEMNPYAYFPDSVLPSYSANLVDEADIVTDYSSFVNKTQIKSNGFGEQLKMVLDNLQQSQTFFNVLSVIEGLSSTSVTVFNNYIDANPADTAHHTFSSGIYSITIDFDGTNMFYVVEYTANIPALGEQAIQLALSMDVETAQKTVRIQLGDANALTYTVTENEYTFAIKYLGARSALFSLERKDDGTVKGHIYEYLEVANASVSSAADLYITDKYVSVVGNKASGIPGFTGYICELYSCDNGKLIAYEVREELSKIVYNTLWFDLSSVDGITSIKYEKTDKSENFYVNGLSDAWKSKKVGGLDPKTLSRRFDIEFRNQYFYTYDEETKTYNALVAEVPMLFVQEEVYDTLTRDIAEVNANVNARINTANTDLTKLLDDYDTLLAIFIANKDSVTAEFIIDYIGDKVVFP